MVAFKLAMHTLSLQGRMLRMKAKGHRHRMDQYFERQARELARAAKPYSKVTPLVRTGIVKRDKPTIISQAKRAPGKYRTGMMVGFYGCKGVLVRVAWQRTKDNQPGPRAVVIPECPACKHRHGATRFMWRKAHSEEEFNSAMVAL